MSPRQLESLRLLTIGYQETAAAWYAQAAHAHAIKCDYAATYQRAAATYYIQLGSVLDHYRRTAAEGKK